MAGLAEFKKRLHEDESFKEKFVNVREIEQAVELAQNLGFNVSYEDFENDSELSEDMLESVAGGKNNETKNVTNTTFVVDTKAYELVIDKKTGDIIDSEKREKAKF